MIDVRCGHVLDELGKMPSDSVQCVVTSPPYWNLRSYLPDDHPDKPKELGLEDTPETFVASLVDVFRAVRRVLRDDGTCWVNLGDSYAGAPGGEQGREGQRASRTFTARITKPKAGPGLKPKDLVGIPWRVAFALQADGWFLRSDIIWHKPNPMPESITDRPTKAHEYVFLLTKSARYFYDLESIREEPKPWNDGAMSAPKLGEHRKTDAYGQQTTKRYEVIKGANARTVWTIPSQPFPGAHFATFPEELPTRCIKAGSRPGDLVLDPFTGAGTTALVAIGLGRRFVGCELNPEYAAMARARVQNRVGIFAAAQKETGS